MVCNVTKDSELQCGHFVQNLSSIFKTYNVVSVFVKSTQTLTWKNKTTFLSHVPTSWCQIKSCSHSGAWIKLPILSKGGGGVGWLGQWVKMMPNTKSNFLMWLAIVFFFQTVFVFLFFRHKKINTLTLFMFQKSCAGFIIALVCSVVDKYQIILPIYFFQNGFTGTETMIWIYPEIYGKYVTWICHELII